MKLFGAVYSGLYPFDEMGLFTDGVEGVIEPGHLEEGGALVVWGGGDISPSLYNKEVSKYTGAGAELSQRDFFEWELMKRAKELRMPIIGICRGAQMLCALAGGYLVQDITNHAGGDHPVVTEEGLEIRVSSLHHQMLYPWDVEHRMIAQTPVKYSRHYKDVNDDIDVPCEPEFVYFPKEKGIAIQWHPEYMSLKCDANKYVQQKVKELLEL